MSFAKVDFPEPLCPKTETKEPLGTLNDISSITLLLPSYEKLKFLISNLLMLEDYIMHP